MKACIVLQNQYHLLGHALACLLKERHGIEQFVAYVYSPEALEFVGNQSDIIYSSVLSDHELHARHKNEPVDIEFVRRFEEEYFPPNIWQYLYSDRKLMMSIGPKEETTAIIDPCYDHETLIKAFQARARAIEDMLKKERPDFILFFAIGSIGHKILYQIARKLGIRTYNIALPQLGLMRAISEDHGRLSGAMKIAKSSPGPSARYIKEARELIDTVRKSGSLQLEYYVHNAEEHEVHLSSLRRLIRSMKYVFLLWKRHRANKDMFIYGTTNEHPMRFIAHKLKRYIRGLRGYRDLWDTIPAGESYAYFALHFEPELATLAMSPFYFDQIALLRQISRSLPLEFKLYVKDHPGMRNRRGRKFFKELRKLPNVRLIDTGYKGVELIRNAKLVMTITGTAGWEATLLGKPVITFGKVFYNDLSFVARVHNIETLPDIIRKQLYDFCSDEKELSTFVAASLQDSTPLHHHHIWYETNIEKVRRDPEVVVFADMLFKKASGESEL